MKDSVDGQMELWAARDCRHRPVSTRWPGAGYVVRRHDRDDRRRNIVALTRKGVAAADRIIAGQLEVECELVGALTQSQQDQLTNLLRRLPDLPGVLAVQ